MLGLFEAPRNETLNICHSYLFSRPLTKSQPESSKAISGRGLKSKKNSVAPLLGVGSFGFRVRMLCGSPTKYPYMTEGSWRKERWSTAEDPEALTAQA